jgi:transposase InsO family protein
MEKCPPDRRAIADAGRLGEPALRYVTKYRATRAMGRKPEGTQPLSGAERQARYRARHNGIPMRPHLTKPRLPPRPQRWRAAVAELVALQSEYAAWLEALPQATRDGATGEALQAIVDLDLDELVAIRPPRGFGRD